MQLPWRQTKSISYYRAGFSISLPAFYQPIDCTAMTYFVLVIYTPSPTAEGMPLRSCVNALQRMGLETVLTDDDGCDHSLPVPVLAGEFIAPDVRQCREYVYDRVQTIFNDYDIQGKLFVLVSEQYTWTAKELYRNVLNLREQTRSYGLQ